jgi:hypothetical protein
MRIRDGAIGARDAQGAKPRSSALTLASQRRWTEASERPRRRAHSAAASPWISET